MKADGGFAATCALMLVLCCCVFGCASKAPPETAAAPERSRVLASLPSSEAAERERAARRSVQDARAFLMQGRPEAALRATTRGLLARPDDAALLRERARALTWLGRVAEAETAQANADRLDPPAPPLPDTPRAGAFDDLLIVLQAPDIDLGSERAVADARAARAGRPALVARLRTRLPGVALVEEAKAGTDTVPDARAWLVAAGRPRIAGVRIVRALCGESVKDGRYAIASLHRTEASPAAATPVDGPVRFSGAREADDAAICAEHALARALERWLASPFFDAGTASPQSADVAAPAPRPATPDRETVLALMPGLRGRIEAEHASARRALFVGDLERARAAYTRIRTLDPEDTDVTAHLEEIDATIELGRELAALEAAQRGDAAAPRAQDAQAGLPPALTPAQRAALEAQLEDERRRRDDLLATLATVSGDRRAAHVPEAALRSTDVVDPQAPGVRRALAALESGAPGGPIVPDRLRVKTLHAPSGALLARYYFDAHATAQTVDAPAPPLLVEEDVSGDGQLDRWTSYRDGIRTAVWEQRRGDDLPDLHVHYDADGRSPERLELDAGLDGRPDRVYEYERGRLVRAARDTNDDGIPDRFDTFDADGRVALREEDLTGDGQIDIRTTFVEGRLVKRELMDPETVIAR